MHLYIYVIPATLLSSHYFHIFCCPGNPFKYVAHLHLAATKHNDLFFFFPVVSFILSFIFTPLPAFNNSFVCGNSTKGHKISWHVSQSIWCVPFTMNVHSLWQGSWCWCPNWEISLRIFSFRVHIFPFWLRFKNKLYSMQIVKISTSLKYS